MRAKTLIQRFVLSRITGLSLVALLIIQCLIGVNIPQVSETAPAFLARWRTEHPSTAYVVDLLRLDRLYSSEIFLVLIGILFIVMLCSVFRLYRSVKNRHSHLNAEFDRRHSQVFFSFTASSETATATSLERGEDHGYLIREMSVSRYHLQKYGVSRWGTVIFHAGLLVIIAAGLLTFLFEQRGFVQVLERDTFFGNATEFLSSENGPLASPFVPDLALSLETLSPFYYDNGQMKDLQSSVLVGGLSEQPERSLLSINNPVEVNGVKIFQSTSFGYAVCLVFEKDGFSAPTYFSLDHPRKLGQPFFGKSDFPTTPYEMNMELFPDRTNRSFLVHDPVLRIVFSRDGLSLGSTTMTPGESIEFQGGKLVFKDIRHWIGIILAKNRSVPLVFFGFAIALLGLTMIYGFPMREIIVHVERSEGRLLLSFAGFARRDRALLAEEFKKLMESIYMSEGVVDVGTELVEV